ncbi:M56 family metallopeptidase [Pontibacter chitinilyticus]|uniref:M56 family metallopeptidase n=1 Tax=Pontibacter chitinilyticus TaxID=2674989 RepID=UPI00321ACE8D
MNLIPNLVPEALVRALGWSLLHSLWQGAVVALLLGLLLVLLHRHSAKTRYAVAGASLLVQVLLSVGTFIYYYTRSNAVLNTAAVADITLHTPATGQAASFWQAPFGVAQAYFDQHLPLLVTVWLLGVLLMLLRFIGGIAYTQRLRHYKVAPLAQAWQNKLHLLSQRMALHRTVRLVESGLVKVPMTIGFAKPIILLPLGAVTGLSQKQVEAILAHELAHILRKDYLLNLLQSVVDMLFFYHPAMWWISGIVRAERENCCDDMAVAVCGDTQTYARALAELAAMRLPAAPAMSVAFSGRGSLVSRIKRLVGQPSLRPTFSEGFMAAIVLLIGLTGLSFGAVAGLHTSTKLPKEDMKELLLQQSDHVTALPEKAPAANVLPKPDTTLTAPANKANVEEEATSAFVYKVQQGSGQAQDVVIIKNKKGKVTELYVNGKRIPKKDMASYNDLINQRLEAVKQAPSADAAEVRRNMEAARAAVAATYRRVPVNINYQREYSFEYNGDSLLVPPPPPPAPPLPDTIPLPALPPMPPAPPMPPLDGKGVSKKDQKAYEKALKSYEEQMRQYDSALRDQERAGAVSNRYRRQVQQQRELTRQQAAISLQHAQIAREHAALAAEHAMMARRHAADMEKIKKEMVKDGLIPEKTSELSIQLNEKGLYINGKKQPDAVYEKYKKLMQPNPDDKGTYNMQYREQ